MAGATIGLHVVISHCTMPLDWIWNRALAGEKWKSMTIYSKCGVPLRKEDLPPDANVVILPNVGRCDHSYAYWIAETLDKIKKNSSNHAGEVMFQPQDHVMFMKDNDNSYRKHMEHKVPLAEMKNITETEGFSCASRVRLWGSNPLNVAVRSNLGGFRYESYTRRDSQRVANSPSADVPFKSGFASLEAWYRSLPISLKLGSRAPLLPEAEVYHRRKAKEASRKFTSPHSTYFVPMCYGGHFMATIQQLQESPVGDWNAIVRSLSRGDNIEEGHFMERIWAGLLSRPISKQEEEAILKQDYAVIRTPKEHPYRGLVTIVNSR